MANNIKNNESKSDRFKRIATSRTNEILHRLKILGNCSNRLLYEYSDEDIKKIFKAIDEKIKEIKTKFNNPQINKKDEFSL